MIIAELVSQFEHETNLLRRTLLAAYAAQEIVAHCGDVKPPCALNRKWVTLSVPLLAALFEAQPAGFASALLWKLAHTVDMSTVHLKALAHALAAAPPERHEALVEHWRMRAATWCPASVSDRYASGWIAYRTGRGPGGGREEIRGWLDSRQDMISDSKDYVEFLKEKLA
jgi:hypothetical protein